MPGPFKIVTAAALLVAVAVSATPAAQAANPAVCAAYASGAVMQQNKNLAMGCGYFGPRWMKNYGLHYAWCLGAPLGAVQAEGMARKTMLQQCAGGPPPGPLVKTFINPTRNGLRLDWCYSWAHNCGAYAAKAYCVSKGYPLVVGWGKANNIGLTRLFSTGAVCNNPQCDGFTYITCKK